MPEETVVTTISKADLASRPATDAEQTLINERISKGEPAFEEERVDFVPKKEEDKEDTRTDAQKESEARSEEIKELGLEEDATDDDIATKKQENAEAKVDDLKTRAVALDLPEDSTEEDIVAKEAEKKDDDDSETDIQAEFDKADDVEKGDLITELELKIEKEDDEESKKEMQKTLDKWNTAIEAPEPKKDERTLDEEVADYAKEKEISEEDAREVIEGREAVSKKYGDDPKKLAHALRSLQGEYTNEKKSHVNTVKALEQAKLKVMMSSDIKPEEMLVKPDGSKMTREETIQAYRTSYPGQTDGKEDDEVYDLQRQHVLRHVQMKQTESQATVKADAKSKRVELLSNLSKDAEPYKASIKKMLDDSPDGQVVQKGFDLEDMVLWHKGKDSDKLVKEAEKRGYKRGLERKRVLGEIKSPSGKVKTKTDVQGAKDDYGLNADQKQEALEFFKENNIPEQRKYELFADMKKKTDK